MTWLRIALAAVVGGSLVFFLTEKKKPYVCPTCWPPPPRVNPQEVAAQTKKMKELLEATQKVVASFNQRRDVEEITLNGPTVDDLAPWRVLTFPSMATSTAVYQSKVAQEHTAGILLPQNLLDPEQRAASRASLVRLRSYLASYRLSLPTESEHIIFLCGNDRWARAYPRSLRFYRSQFDLEADRLDEMAGVLDMMDGAPEAALDDERIMFPTSRQQEDYERSVSRISRLEELRATRDKLLQQYVEQKSDRERITYPPGTWDFLSNSGITVELDTDQIRINRKLIVLPVKEADLIAVLGEPREDEGEAAQSIWDGWGIAAVHKAGTSQIRKLIIALRPKKAHAWPTTVIRGRLTLLGIPVDEHSTPRSLNRKFGGEKFVSDDSGWAWTLSLQGYTVETQFNWDGTIDSLTIHTLPSRP